MRWRPVAWRGNHALLSAVAAVPFSALTPSPSLAQDAVNTPAAVVLHSVAVRHSDEQLIITLTADGPIAGEMRHIAGGSTRLFVDLRGVRPQVAPVTPVDRGPVHRVRVGLNSSNPPITRVVIDVSELPPARIEQGDSDAQLRIVIGGPRTGARDEVIETTAEKASGGAAEADVQWCAQMAARLAEMLKTTPAASQPAMLASASAWQALERELAGRKVARSLQQIHFMLSEAARLGRIGTAYWSARQFEHADAAHAGARLLTVTAQTHLEQVR